MLAPKRRAAPAPGRIAFAAAASVATVAVVGWIGMQDSATPAGPSVAQVGPGRRRGRAGVRRPHVVPLNNVNEYLVVHRQLPNARVLPAGREPGRGRPMRRLAAALPVARAPGGPAGGRGPRQRPAFLAAARRRLGAHQHLRGHRRAHAGRAHVHLADHAPLLSAAPSTRRSSRSTARAARSCATTRRCSASSRTRRPSASTGASPRGSSPRWWAARRRRSPSTTSVKLGDVERVLGQDCQWIHLDPRDALRYAQRLCAEIGSGPPAARQDARARSQQVLEQYTFTDLRLGPAGLAQRAEEHVPRAEQGLAPRQPAARRAQPGRDRLDGRHAAARLPAGERDAAHAPQPRRSRSRSSSSATGSPR